MSVLFSEICGGITAPGGFVAGSAFCGIKKGNKKKHDMALIYSREESTVAAATFTTNKVKAAPVRVSVEHMSNPHVRAIVVNSGNANACTGLTGIEHAKRMAVAAGKALGLKERQVLVCSTGRIGVEMPIKKMEQTIKKLPKALQSDGSLKAAAAIMTSDTFAKEVAVELVIDDKTVRIGGIAKGAGMIDPNMATMLCFITTDAAIGKKELQHALSIAVEQSFNRITVDGDMSTNDTVIALANGLAGNRPLKTSHANSQIFQNALNYVTLQLARMIVEDGEGVTKFVEVHVQGAATYNDARKAAEAVAKSTLVKCAWFGCDPNWGRIMDALGYCSIKLREEMVDIFYDGVIAVKNGMASKTPFSKLQDVVAKEKFTITIDMHLGSSEYIVYTTDLSTRYVELNMGE
ncbi:MAG: bifunctional glutamate N-acetyltransferase/amino-acid acetyltransferase ArgJ [Chthoniobacteraceae bacterium]